MGAVETDIELSATGGDAAAAEVKKASGALEGLGTSSSNLKEKFQERFQHMGLQLFAGDALRASGLGRETRAVISTLNLALQEGGAMAGLSSGGVMLFVAALGALIGVIVKVIEHHKTLNEELQKTNDANHKQLESTQNVISSIEAYITTTGRVPEYLKRWENSERDLEKAQVERQIQGDKAQLSSLTALMNQARERSEQLQGEVADQEKLNASLKASGIDTATLVAQSAQLTKIRDEYDKQKLSVLDYKAQIDKLIASIRLLRDEGTDDMKKMTDAAKQHADAVRNQEHTAYQQWQKDIDDTAKANEKALKNENEATQKTFKEEGEFIKKVSDQIGGDIGNAFAKSIVEGKSFTDSMRMAFKNMAEQIISDIIRIMVEWSVLTAMGFPVGGAAGGLGHMLGFATGGQVMVDKPTLFLAGEAGPEMATFTPLASMGGGGSSSSGGGGGGDVNIGTLSVPVTIQGVNNPDAIAAQVGRKIVEQIRGAGQLSFVR